MEETNSNVGKKLSTTQIQRKQLEIIAKNLKGESSNNQYSIHFLKNKSNEFNYSEKVVIKEGKSKTTNELLTRDLPSNDLILRGITRIQELL